VTEPSPRPAAGGASGQIVRGLWWVGSLRSVGQAVSWVATVAVARVLVPNDYGLVAMAMVFVNIAQVLADFGIGSTVVAMQDLNRREVEELHAASILLGGVACAVILVCAWPISTFYGQRPVAAVVAALGLVVFMNGAAAVPAARLAKDLDYAGMAMPDLLRNVVGAVSALGLALSGAGVWALVASQLTGAAAAFLYVLRRAPTRVTRPQSGRFREALDYSKETMLSRLAWMFYQGMPALLGGRILGAGPLGQYTFPYTLASMPGDKLATVVMQVAQPVLARHQADRAALKALLSRIVESLAFLTWPILAGLALVADPGVTVVFGEKWAGAVTPLRLLAIFNMSVALFAPFAVVCLVTGAARRNRQISVLGAIILPACFWTGATVGGPSGLAAAWSVGLPLFGIPWMAFLRRGIGYRWTELGGALRAPALATAGMTVVVVPILLLPVMSDVARLVSAVAAGAAVFIAIAAITRGRMLRRFVSTLRRQAD